MKLGKRIMSLILICIIGSCFFIGCSDDENKNFSELEQKSQHNFIKLFSEQAVKNILKNPDKAEFNNDDYKITDLGNHDYEIHGKVKATNSFNAEILQDFYVKLHVKNPYSEEKHGYGCEIIDTKILQ